MTLTTAPATAFLAGGGKTGALMRSHDWSRSPLGQPDSWPQSLRSIVSLLLNSQFPMFIAWGKELGFLYNDAYAEILGRKHPAALGGRFHDIWSEIWDDILPSIEQAMQGNATYHENLPLVMRRKGYDEQTWFTFSYSPVRDESGEVSGMFCAVTETTDQVLLERQLKASNRQKDEFLAMLAHELRNPLAPIAAAADLLRVAPDQASVQRTSGIITRQVEHMTELVDDLLDVSRVTRGLVTLREETLDIGKVLADAVEQIRSLTEAKRQHFKAEFPGEKIFVQGDRTRLIQVFSNILNNASKYTPEGGNISLRVHADGAQVEVVIEDDGIGISQTLLPDIFDAFTQAERSPDRAQGGLGLGLLLVKKLLELQGGEIVAHSGGAGQGSRFTVQLRRLMEGAGSSEELEREQAAMPSAAAERVMVVDDNEDAAQLLALLLQAAGHQTFIAHNAEDALALAQRTSPTVLFLDIGLPDADGYQLARRLRALPNTRHAMLVALTGYGQPGDKERSQESGFDHHLVKPVRIKQVLRLLDEERAQARSA